MYIECYLVNRVTRDDILENLDSISYYLTNLNQESMVNFMTNVTTIIVMFMIIGGGYSVYKTLYHLILLKPPNFWLILNEIFPLI